MILPEEGTGHGAEVNPLQSLCQTGVATPFSRTATTEPHSHANMEPGSARLSTFFFFFQKKPKFKYLWEFLILK